MQVHSQLTLVCRAGQSQLILVENGADCRSERFRLQVVTGKDGRSYWPIKRQAATADRIANHKGRNPQERASLKKRLLRKWMSK